MSAREALDLWTLGMIDRVAFAAALGVPDQSPRTLEALARSIIDQEAACR